MYAFASNGVNGNVLPIRRAPLSTSNVYLDGRRSDRALAAGAWQRTSRFTAFGDVTLAQFAVAVHASPAVSDCVRPTARGSIEPRSC
jgi:hypothetical protein